MSETKFRTDTDGECNESQRVRIWKELKKHLNRQSKQQTTQPKIEPGAFSPEDCRYTVVFRPWLLWF
jgi:hypothetical protein